MQRALRAHNTARVSSSARLQQPGVLRVARRSAAACTYVRVRGPDPQCAALNDTSPSVQGTLQAEIRQLPASEVAATLWGCVLADKFDVGMVSAVAQVAIDDIDRYDADALIAIMSAQAHVGHNDPGFVLAVSRHLAAPYALADTPPGSVVQGMWALAQLTAQGVVEYDSEPALQEFAAALARQAQRQVKDIIPDDVARLLGAMAELGTAPPQALLDDITTRLIDTLIPLAQLTPDSLSTVLFALARLDAYHRGVFDAAQAELQRKADGLDLKAVSNTVWAHSAVRERDAKHRAVYDVNPLATLAARAVQLLQPLCDHAGRPSDSVASNGSSPAAVSSASDSATAAPSGGQDAQATTGGQDLGAGASTSQGPPVAAASNGHSHAALSAAVAAASGGADVVPQPPQTSQSPQLPADPVVVQSLLTTLLAYTELSHHDTPLCTWAAKYLAPRLHQCTAQELVVVSYVYARLKHASPVLMDALAAALPPRVGELDLEDLVYLASVGPSTGVYNAQLMDVALHQALRIVADAEATGTAGTSLDAGALLDLARCVSAVAHQRPGHYDGVQRALLKGVNAAHVASDLEDMTTHCGATDPLGLQK